jgi:hypothetical protein
MFSEAHNLLQIYSQLEKISLSLQYKDVILVYVVPGTNNYNPVNNISNE